MAEWIFWTSLSLEELAARQGVGPAVDLDSISALWPADDDPDRLLAYILDERSSRRRIARGRSDPCPGGGTDGDDREP